MSQNNGHHSKVIIGICELAKFLNVSEPTAKQYLKMGLPGIKINKTWHFHTANINKWFEKVTWAKADPKDDDLEPVNPKNA
jgi:hypothetical protein